MKINEEIAIEWWMEDLHGQLSDERKQALELYLNQYPKLREELMESASTWQELEKVETPGPGPDMEARFRAMLEGYATGSERKRNVLSETFSRWIHTNWQTSLASLCLGLLIGFFLLPQEDDNVETLSAEVSQMKKMLMLSLIEKPQAQERIRAVNMADEVSGSDERITGSLISTLNNDKSINVRLAALEALLAYGNKESVRESLVRSIARQDSPLLQVALADAMLLLQEKKAIREFSNILEAESIDENVRFKLKSTIETLKEI